MPIENKSTEAKQGKGFGGSTSSQASTGPSTQETPVDTSSMVQVIQNSAIQKVVNMVQQADATFTQLEDAGADAILTRESQVACRVLDKVAAGVISQAQKDSIPDAQNLQRQLSQALFEVNRTEAWRTCSAKEMASSNLLFGSPADAMKSAKALPGA
ncbi:hypothetical protein D0962_00095 [Leptolyngbyaceae cyanobacterium CCMR0082]|uniref:Uncharacterized protein n=1 Tax=Adonisia turfae CCMR0082 TaxID=2304604 RepID=A0A6M0RZP7_9CYAN|nr:hypothetical protein [Adonisia turfae]NEZ61192.1 hypothetical protein [Adonisia turfae CCMR0082]